MTRLRVPSSSAWRLLRPSFYLRKPRRLAFIFVLLLCSTFMLWDRQSLVRDHTDSISKLSEERDQLALEVDGLRKILKDHGLHLNNGVKRGGTTQSSTGKGQQDQESDGATVSDTSNKQDIKSSELKHSQEGAESQNDDSDLVTKNRREKIRDAMLHAWSSYEKYAWGYDELQPQSKRGINQFGGLGATIVDSLDTLYIMGFHEQFAKAKEWIASSLDFNKNYDASVFETTIRVLGGLLSSYDLSKEKIFLEKAKELADRLLPAWNTNTGIPYNTINLAHGSAFNPSWNGGSSTLADLGTEQLEFIALSQRTGDDKYRIKVEKVIQQIRKFFPQDGLVPIFINPNSGQPTTSRITFGAMGDSFYEYLLKVWIMGNKTEAVKHYRQMWEQSMEGMTSLIRKSTPSSFTYIAERSGTNYYTDKMDELACFAPGMLALGSDDANSDNAKKYLNLAKELARTCYHFYQSTSSKLASENYYFREGEDMTVGTPYNILRPETVESLMYLWRKTGDQIYREWGWDIFQAFEAKSRTESGYVGLRDVRSGEKDDMMQSFFLAETMKYLYLLFSPSSVIPLDEWVFNTEAHPLRITPRDDKILSLEDTLSKEGE
ncbi:hypothetical protein O6H91_04G145000 [Diphasiastrum complanatum]|uniref:Uncharacterized protein n=1 Tax=Diphasiastrum complanatum TaxID=34168 RepID=A0ACC2E2V7_DIPCM|nr:hypothetical protein O6H91_04G145000 [Diphasiastrum complanatum]